jgi:hypothetical protein
LRKFGKKGEGPGELLPHPEISPQLELYNDNVIVSTPRKIVYFSKEGKFLKEKSLRFFSAQIVHLGENYVMSKVTTNPEGIQMIGVIIHDPQFNEIKTVYSRKRKSPMRKGKMVIPPTLLYNRTSKNKLFVFDQIKGFHIDVFDKKGNPLKPIDVSYEPIKVSKAYKNEVMVWLKTQKFYKRLPPQMKNMFAFPQYLPVMKTFLVKADKIYVQTYKEKDNRAEFYIFDFNGKVLKHVFLPVDLLNWKIQASPSALFTFWKNKFYYLFDNVEKEVWELYSTSVD